jgi:hypothetical protein
VLFFREKTRPRVAERLMISMQILASANWSVPGLVLR